MRPNAMRTIKWWTNDRATGHADGAAQGSGLLGVSVNVSDYFRRDTRGTDGATSDQLLVHRTPNLLQRRLILDGRQITRVTRFTQRLNRAPQ